MFALCSTSKRKAQLTQVAARDKLIEIEHSFHYSLAVILWNNSKLILRFCTPCVMIVKAVVYYYQLLTQSNLVIINCFWQKLVYVPNLLAWLHQSWTLRVWLCKFLRGLEHNVIIFGALFFETNQHYESSSLYDSRKTFDLQWVWGCGRSRLHELRVSALVLYLCKTMCCCQKESWCMTVSCLAHICDMLHLTLIVWVKKINLPKLRWVLTLVKMQYWRRWCGI
jgi:hypothetical protein